MIVFLRGIKYIHESVIYKLRNQYLEKNKVSVSSHFSLNMEIGNIPYASDRKSEAERRDVAINKNISTGTQQKVPFLETEHCSV